MVHGGIVGRLAPDQRLLNEVGPCGQVGGGPGRGLGFGCLLAETHRVERAAEGKDGVGLRLARMGVLHPNGPGLGVVAHDLNKLFARDGADERVRRGTVEGAPDLAHKVPVDEPVAARLLDVEGFAGADDRDGAGVGAERGEGVHRQVGDFDAAIPGRMVGRKVRVHGL